MTAPRLRTAVSILCVVSAAFLPPILALGCRVHSEIGEKLDAGSRQRLAAIPSGHTALVSLSADPVPATLPSLGERGRVLARGAGAVLVEVLPSELKGLSNVKDLSRVAVWGDGDALVRLDPRLRVTVLESWAGDSVEPIPMIAQFKDGPVDLRVLVGSTGATTRSVVGAVVTLDARPDQVFELIARPELLVLRRPVLLRPLTNP